MSTLHHPTKARFLLRFDDLCPTLPWPIWEAIEPMLIEHGVRPLLAVVPDNRDPKLHWGAPAPDFWERVRRWQSLGWSIGLHGYQHRYCNSERGILKRGKKSEFAGLGYAEQFDKLSQGLEIFSREGVRADAWVAPSHSFDWNTVAALSALGLRTISDGLALAPYLGPHHSLWVPQQIARMRDMPFGFWTFCYHFDEFTPASLETFRVHLATLAPRMLGLQDAETLARRGRTLPDRIFAGLQPLLANLNHTVSRVLPGTGPSA